MIYLDYSATTPVSYEVLESYNKTTRDYIGNVNSLHSLGSKSKALYVSATKQISDLLGVLDSEVIYTSGATESNNMALKGVALAYGKRGRSILVSKLEHPSVYSVCNYLEAIGFNIGYVNNNKEGCIDLDDLRKKMTPDTILVSICAVNSELGIRQPLKTIKQVIKKENPNTIFHSDMTQAIGKVAINMLDVDLASLSAHKLYGPKGIGILYKNNKIFMTPLIHGSSKISDFRPGTVPLPLIVSMAKALRMALDGVDRKELLIRKLNEKICEHLADNKDILINKTKYSIPHILSVSLVNIKPETFIHAMEEHDIYLGTNTACKTGDISSAIMAVFGERRRAMTSVRISLSHLTTNEDINKFLKCFDEVFNKLNTLGA